MDQLKRTTPNGPTYCVALDATTNGPLLGVALIATSLPVHDQAGKQRSILGLHPSGCENVGLPEAVHGTDKSADHFEPTSAMFEFVKASNTTRPGLCKNRNGQSKLQSMGHATLIGLKQTRTDQVVLEPLSVPKLEVSST